MVKHQIGLTQTYNRLKDPSCVDPEVAHLRHLHEEMDRTVLDAYGWRDIAVPSYGTPATDAEKKALETFEDEVLDRLFALNAERAEDEKRGLSPRAVPVESGVLPVATESEAIAPASRQTPGPKKARPAEPKPKRVANAGKGRSR